MFKRISWSFSLVLLLAMVVSACAPVAPTAAPAASSDSGAAASGTTTYGQCGAARKKWHRTGCGRCLYEGTPEFKIEIWAQPWGDYFPRSDIVGKW